MHFRAGLPVAIKTVAVGTESSSDLVKCADNKVQVDSRPKSSISTSIKHGLSSRARYRKHDCMMRVMDEHGGIWNRKKKLWVEEVAEKRREHECSKRRKLSRALRCIYKATVISKNYQFQFNHCGVHCLAIAIKVFSLVINQNSLPTTHGLVPATKHQKNAFQSSARTHRLVHNLRSRSWRLRCKEDQRRRDGERVQCAAKGLRRLPGERGFRRVSERKSFDCHLTSCWSGTTVVLW